MNQTILEEARAVLAGGAVSLPKLHERLKMAGSAWSESQHHLFFLAFAGSYVYRSGDQVMVHSGERSPKERLISDIVEVVESFYGRPVSAEEIRKRLPTDYVTTNEQVKAIARMSDNLEVYGPGLIRKKS
jgi:hypothetical protein